MPAAKARKHVSDRWIALLALALLAVAPALAAPAKPEAPAPPPVPPAPAVEAPEPPDPEDLLDLPDEGGKVRSGDKVAFGNDVVVEADEVVRGNVVCFGGKAVVKGKVRGDVVVIGGSLVMSGSARGEVVGVGSKLLLEDSAEISGDFVNVGGSAERNDAKIHGQFVNVGLGLPLTGLASAPFSVLGFLIFWGKVLWLLLLFIAFLLLAALVPERIRVISEETPLKFGIALLAGFVGWIVFVLVEILTAITIIGIPITILMFVVFAVLRWLALAGLFHYVGSRIGRMFFKREMSLLGAILLGFLPFAALRFLPFCIGTLIWMFLQIVAVGLLIVTRVGSTTARTAPPPPPPPHGPFDAPGPFVPPVPPPAAPPSAPPA